MYIVLSRQNAFEETIEEYYSKLEDAQAHVQQKMAQIGDYADRLHPEAYKIVQLIETAGGPSS